jgi:hypothetical protein
MKLLLLLFIMSTHFDEAFIVSEDAPGLLVEQDFSTDRLFDFAAASREVEESDGPSDDEDGLYDESVSHVPQLVDDELGDDEDTSTADDGDFSWRIDHATGDHKLKGTFDSIALMFSHP